MKKNKKEETQNELEFSDKVNKEGFFDNRREEKTLPKTLNFEEKLPKVIGNEED